MCGVASIFKIHLPKSQKFHFLEWSVNSEWTKSNIGLGITGEEAVRFIKNKINKKEDEKNIDLFFVIASMF